MAVHGVSCTIRFCYGHRILGHKGGCGHPHGHNARAEVECRGPLDRLGMVVDFGEVQARLRGFVDSTWDHWMIL
jgi:6-pyruvoyltetrahydropterin/6-carboxytetrahydropterin synthase